MFIVNYYVGKGKEKSMLYELLSRFFSLFPAFYAIFAPQ